MPGLPTGSISAGVPSGLASLTVAVSPGEPSQLPHPSAEIYSRIARGANRCWFGGQGRIAKTHMLHADADPSASGGKVEIVVHERAVDQPKPWGYKAFRVALAESAGLDGGAATSIEVEGTRFPDAEARRMRAEVFRWARGEEGCISDPTLDKPIEAVAPAPAAVAAKPAKAAKGKAKPRTAAAGVPSAPVPSK